LKVKDGSVKAEGQTLTEFRGIMVRLLEEEKEEVSLFQV
jgi:hypothetical protein